MKPVQTALLFITTVCLLSGFRQNNNSIEQYPTTSPSRSEYEVRFTHTGYIVLYGTLEDCPIRSKGKAILKGLLSGEENGKAGDPVLYTGILDIDIDMDICSAKRLANGEDKLCEMTVKGKGQVLTELELTDATTNQISYIKINYDSTKHGKFQKSVGGTCDQQQQAEEEYMTPNETIASIFNGRDLPMLTRRTLQVGTYVEKDGDQETVVEVIRKIR